MSWIGKYSATRQKFPSIRRIDDSVRSFFCPRYLWQFGQAARAEGGKVTRNFLHGNQLCRGRCACVHVCLCVCMCVCVMLSLCTTTVVETSRNEHSPRTTVCEHGTIENNCRKTFDSSNKRSSPEFCLLSIGRFSFFFFFFSYLFLFYQIQT